MRRLFAIIVAAIAFIGCSMDDITVSYQTDKSDIYYASFENIGEESRTYVDKNVKLLWHEDDRISLFRTTLNEQFKFTGATGDNSGSFSAIPSDEFVTGNEVSTNYAVYPYDATTKLSNDEIIQLTMPAVQHYAKDSFGRGANTMVAASENTSSTLLPFRNLGGYIIVKLYGEDTTIKSIEFKGNNEEVIAGAATAEAKYGYLPVIAMSESGTTTITLECGEEGVTISSDSDNPTSFWFVVPPITFEGGFTFTITDIKGNTFTKSTTKSQTVVRNEVKSMSGFEPTFEGEGEDPEVAPKPANNEIWYTATAKVEPYRTNVFGANIVSNEWNETTGEGVITFDSEVTKIGNRAFYYCSDLTSVTIPNNVTEIGESAFEYCRITSVTIPNNVTTIGLGAFFNCTSLTSLTIGDSVKTIGSEAFDNCYNLTSVTIPDSVTTIGSNVFNKCSRLISVIIGNSVTSIGNKAFYDCSSLTSVTIPNSVTTIGNYAFYGCKKLTSVTIPNRVTEIGECTFYDCSSLTSVTIPNSVTTIGNSAFDSCFGLTSITIGDSVKVIGEWAFSNCKFTCVTIPESVTTIGEGAFYDCSNLTSVYCRATTPPSLGRSYVFDSNGSDRKIYVPNESVEKYTSATNWISYAYCIVGYDLYEVVDMGLSVKWAATNVGADSPEELGNLYAWGEVTPKAEYSTSNYAWWTYDYGEDGDGWWSTTSIKKYGSSYSNSDYIQWDGYYASYYWVNDGLTVLDLEDDAARTGWGGSWRMPTQAECQELVDNCTIEKVKYNNCDGFLFTSTKAGYTDKKLFFPLTPSKQLEDETTYAQFYSGLFWSSTQYLPFPACAYVFRSRYPYTSCTLGPITREAGFPVRPVKQ